MNKKQDSQIKWTPTYVGESLVRLIDEHGKQVAIVNVSQALGDVESKDIVAMISAAPLLHAALMRFSFTGAAECLESSPRAWTGEKIYYGSSARVCAYKLFSRGVLPGRIATIDIQDHYGKLAKAAEQKEIMQLILAAPAMLAACQSIAQNNHQYLSNDDLTMLHEAIALATRSTVTNQEDISPKNSPAYL